jgi:hypothetical protein
MSIPTAYTDKQLALYMRRVLGPTAESLGWDVANDDAGDYAEIVTDTLLAIGITDITEATDIEQIRAVARWQAWRWAADALATKFDLSTDGQSLSRSQLYEHAVRSRDAAYAAAAPHLTTYAVTATRIVHTDDPVDAPVRYHALRGW